MRSGSFFKSDSQIAAWYTSLHDWPFSPLPIVVFINLISHNSKWCAPVLQGSSPRGWCILMVGTALRRGDFEQIVIPMRLGSQERSVDGTITQNFRKDIPLCLRHWCGWHVRRSDQI